MLERLIRWTFGMTSSVLTVGVVVLVLWPLWGVGPDRVLFWALVGPLAAFLLLYHAANGARSVLGSDLSAERDRLAAATASNLRLRYSRRTKATG